MFNFFKKKESKINFEKNHPQRLNYEKYDKYFDIISNDDILFEFLSYDIKEAFIQNIKNFNRGEKALVNNLFKIRRSIEVIISKDEIVASTFDKAKKTSQKSLLFRKCSYKPQKELDVQLLTETMLKFVTNQLKNSISEKEFKNDYGTEVASYFTSINPMEFAYKIEYSAIREMVE